MTTKKYISLGNLTSFLNNLKTLFATKTEMDSKANVSHTHAISDVSSLQTTLNGKAASSHSHSISNVTNLQTILDGKASNSHTHNTTDIPDISIDWSGITSKPSYYDAKAIKSITRNGTTFTYTCMDGTTGTFTQQDNNATYSVATTSANGLMSASDKAKLDTIELATIAEVKTYLSI